MQISYSKTAQYLLICVVLFFSAALTGQDYYVSGALGSDSNNGTEASPFKTINKGIQLVSAGGTVYVMNGSYQNPNYGNPNPSSTDGSLSTGMNNEHVVTINKSGNETNGYITLRNYPGHTPKIQFDGKGGILIDGNSSYIIVEGFEVEGPSADINYTQANTAREYKIYLAEDGFDTPKFNQNYFSGKGIWGGYTAHHHIIIRNNIVHDTPGSAIRFNDSDHITIENNTVYNATWWTSSASSAIVFAETISMNNDDNGTDVKMIMRGNTVYNNWNRILFYVSQLPDNSGNENQNYGTKNFTQIWDGQGLYVTRSDSNYNGTFLFENNLCVNNGKNGINFDHSLAASAIMRNNTIYFNGVHEIIQDISVAEGNTAHRGQKVGGIKSNKVKNVTVVNNIVVTRDSDFSTLELPNVSGSKTVTNNIFLNGSVAFPGNQVPANMINVAPEFVNVPTTSDDATSMLGWEGYLEGTDFSLLETSPAIDAGNSSHSPQLDINGNARPSVDENTISYSSFESATDGWSAFGSTVVRSSTASRTGNESLKTTGRTANYHSPRLSLNTLLTVGETYTFYVWVKLATGVSGTTQLTIKQTTAETATYNNLTTAKVASASQWTRLSADYTHTAADDTFVYVKGPSSDNGLGDYYIDDFSLVPQGNAEVDFTSSGDKVDIGAYEFQRELGSETFVNNDQMILYPNPTTKTITISNLNNAILLGVYDLSGKKHDLEMRTNYDSYDVTIDVSSLKSGVYFAHINDSKKTSRSLIFVRR